MIVKVCAGVSNCTYSTFHRVEQGHPACSVLSSYSPERFMLYQNRAAFCNNERKVNVVPKRFMLYQNRAAFCNNEIKN